MPGIVGRVHKEIGDELHGIEIVGAPQVKPEHLDDGMAEAREDGLDCPYNNIYKYKVFGHRRNGRYETAKSVFIHSCLMVGPV